MMRNYETDPVGHCIDALSDPDASIRFDAADILRGLGRDAAQGIEPLGRAAADDPDARVRAQATFALAELAGVLPDAVREVAPALVRALGSSDGETRSLAAMGLGALGWVPLDVGASLDGCSGDTDGRVRVEVAFARWRLGRTDGGDAVAALVAELREGTEEARELAARRLGGLPPTTMGVDRALAQALADRSEIVRAAARPTLARNG